MERDDDAVGRHVDVGLEVAEAEVDGVLERRQGVLRAPRWPRRGGRRRSAPGQSRNGWLGRERVLTARQYGRPMAGSGSAAVAVHPVPLAGERFTGTESAEVQVALRRRARSGGSRCAARPTSTGRSAMAKAALAAGAAAALASGPRCSTPQPVCWPSAATVRRDHRRGGGQADEDGPRRGRAGGGARSSSPPPRRARWPVTWSPLDAIAERRRQGRLHDARADRRRRGDQPVQLPAQPRRPQAGTGHRRRVPGRAEAGEPDAVQRDRPRRAVDRRLRTPAGVAARRHRRGVDGRQRASSITTTSR